jgi:hypothetical protein
MVSKVFRGVEMIWHVFCYNYDPSSGSVCFKRSGTEQSAEVCIGRNQTKESTHAPPSKSSLLQRR